jgi:ribosome-associated toxin RatA of RatAB toxin-antitoxin module
MASVVTREIVIGVPREALFDLIVDYARYPEFVPAVKACRPRRNGAVVDAEYELDLGVKTIRYTLRHVEERPRKVSWSLVSGTWMKVSSGSWELAEEGKGRGRATRSRSRSRGRRACRRRSSTASPTS